jgi:type II secretory pathway component GspD/PulD (secretin)
VQKGPGGEIQLSFSGADIDTVVRWLAEATGKSIVKQKEVACQLTIVSSRKLPPREAIGLVLQALALEGYSAVETKDYIFLVPEAKEGKIGAEIAPGPDGLLEGKQILVKVFQLEHAEASRLKDKLKGVLSEKGKHEVDERANKIIVTDYADNVRLVGEVIKELDVATVSDSAVEIVTLKYAKAEDLASLVGALYGSSTRQQAQPQGGPPQEGGQPPRPPGAAAPAGEAVRILADKSGNRLIITASQKKMPEIKDLIAQLDAQKPADLAVRVISLQHVNARDLVQEIQPLYQKLRGDSFKDSIEIAASSRANALIVLSSEANHEDIKKLVAALDTKEAQEKTIRTFPLKHADAEDVADQLTDLYQRRGSGYYDYYYERSDRRREGEIRFVADRRRNSVIAIAPPSSLQGVDEAIKALDEPVEGENLVPKIYPLKFVSAVDIEEVLNELLLKRTQRRRYYSYDYDEYSDEQRDIGRLYGKVRIASETYSQENFEAVDAILKQLDVPSQAGETTMNVPLKYAKAVTLANNLNILFAQGGSPGRRQVQQEGQPQAARQQGQQTLTAQTSFELEEEVVEESYFPWLGCQQDGQRSFEGRTTTSRPVSDLVGRVRVVPDLRTNSLLVTTNAHFFTQFLRVVNDLDVPTPQVLIEAKIVEVTRDDRLRLGVRWSPDGSQVFDSDDLDDSIAGTSTMNYKNIFAGGALADALETGVLGVDVNLDFLIQFLEKNTESRVRAEPRINVADNERGKLFVGARVPFISGSVNTPEGGRNDTFQYIDVGIILEVTPHINATGEVALRIRVEASQIRQGETLFGGAILDTRNYRTDLSVKTGQTLVLGGIIQREESQVERGVPILSDIPILGWLFKKRDTVQRDVELMVFLRPKVTQSPEEVEELMKKEGEGAPGIRQWEEDLKAERGKDEQERAEKAKAPAE